jgi:hypothetical protein
LGRFVVAELAGRGMLTELIASIAFLGSSHNSVAQVQLAAFRANKLEKDFVVDGLLPCFIA